MDNETHPQARKKTVSYHPLGGVRPTGRGKEHELPKARRREEQGQGPRLTTCTAHSQRKCRSILRQDIYSRSAYFCEDANIAGVAVFVPLLAGVRN